MSNEAYIAARARHIEICDGNLCAAVLLSEFIIDFGLESPYAEVDESRIYTHSMLVKNTFHVFPLEEVNKALLAMMRKDFISATWAEKKIDDSDDLPFEDRKMVIVVHWGNIEKASHPYYARMEAERERAASEWRASHPEERVNQLPPPTPEELEKRQKEATLARETQRVKSHVKRAMKAKLPATLTVEEWMGTLNFFEWKCAYCGGEFNLLEHFIPIAHYAGTTKDNCVPSCHGCNSVKQGWHPDNIPYSSKKHSKLVQTGIVRVREYLQSIREVGEQ